MQDGWTRESIIVDINYVGPVCLDVYAKLQYNGACDFRD